MQTDLVEKYFSLSEPQRHAFGCLPALYKDWNEKINVISRKDIDNLMERHVLHSLGIAKFYSFSEGEKVIDIGTGGGFPGIPLAILFPQTQFHLVDSIGKKIKVVEAIVSDLGLENVSFAHARVESLPAAYDFAVSRGVAEIGELYRWAKKLIKKSPGNTGHGLICLKGGDLKEEFEGFKHHVRFHSLEQVYEEEFFKSKKVVYVPL